MEANQFSVVVTRMYSAFFVCGGLSVGRGDNSELSTYVERIFKWLYNTAVRILVLVRRSSSRTSTQIVFVSIIVLLLKVALTSMSVGTFVVFFAPWLLFCYVEGRASS